MWCNYSPPENAVVQSAKSWITYPRLILSTAGGKWSGIAVRYLKVQCTSAGTWQTHELGQSALEGCTAARINRALSNHLRRYEALQAHTLIVHGDEASGKDATL